jgi:flagellin
MNGVINNTTMLVGRQGYLRAQAKVDKALERLATGKRIHRASDDPAGMIAADKLGIRRVTLEELIKVSEQASRMLDAAEGALSEITTLAEELNGLTVSAANRSGTTVAEREAMQIEAESIVQAMAHIVKTTRFGGKLILKDGDGMMLNDRWIGYNGLDAENLGRTSIEVTDPATGDTRTEVFSLQDIRSGRLTLAGGDTEHAQKVVQAFIKDISARRAGIGLQQKYTFGHQLDAMRTEHENTTAAESAIRDADFATEMSEFIRGSVLREASLSVMQIGQQQALKALSLLG